MVFRTLALAATILAATTGLASATFVSGTFTGTFTGGTDNTGVFTIAGTDLTGAALTGTVSYDTDQFMTTTSGTSITGASALLPTSLQFYLTAFGSTYAFTSDTNASIFVDPAASQITLVANNSEQPAAILFGDSISLDVYDFVTPFITAADLAQSFTASLQYTSGIFAISQFDTSSNLQTSGAEGTFTLSSYSLSTNVPEPMTAALLGTGVVVALVGRRVCSRFRSA